jgi:nucleoside-diphosphate-sugar epimerase
MTVSRIARACGWWSVPVPGAAVAALSTVAERIPGLPPEVEWLNAFREPTLMDTAKARRELGWEPRWDADATLRETVAAARAADLL